MTWKTTNNIINGILQGIGKPGKDEIESVWNNIEESEIARVETFKNGEIVLRVKNSAYLQVMTFKREEIKEKLNHSLDNKVKSIKIRL